MAPLTCRPIDLFSTWMLGVAIDVEQDHLRSLYQDIFRLIGGFVLSVHELSQPDVISLCSNGCAEAMLERGDRYMWGSFLHQIHCNFNHAATWFQKSAALGNANAHHARNLPIMLAGGGFKHGQYIAQNEGTPLCNLFVTMLNNMGLETNSFGQSTGELSW